MVLAELELFQSRPIAPTRRVALGSCSLPVSPAPGFGGLLLAGVAAAFIGQVDADLHPDLVRLSHQLELGHRIPQPRLRHRFQTDHVGLNRRVHRLVGDGEALRLDLDTAPGTSPGPQVLAVVYAAGRLPVESRIVVMRTIRRGLRWRGPADGRILEALTGSGGDRFALTGRFVDPEAWALGVLGLTGPTPDRQVVQSQFRRLVRVAHPDHGGGTRGAADRIAELSEARRILMAS